MGVFGYGPGWGWMMAAYLEVWTPAGRELVALEAGRLTLGADPANDLALPADPTVSRLHAVLERYGADWCIRDLDSRTVLAGEAFSEPASIREIADALWSPRPPSSSTWRICTTSSASTAAGSGAGCGWPTRRCAAGR